VQAPIYFFGGKMLLIEFNQKLENAVIIYDRLDYLRELCPENEEIKTLFNELKLILNSEIVTHNANELIKFLDNYEDQVWKLCETTKWKDCE
jgi:hypothetical protein